MKPAKLSNMVVEMPKRKPGRPRKFASGSRIQIVIPDDLRKAAIRMQEDRQLVDLPDALRELLREAAEARGLVKPRK